MGDFDDFDDDFGDDFGSSGFGSTAAPPAGGSDQALVAANSGGADSTAATGGQPQLGRVESVDSGSVKSGSEAEDQQNWPYVRHRGLFTVPVTPENAYKCGWVLEEVAAGMWRRRWCMLQAPRGYLSLHDSDASGTDATVVIPTSLCRVKKVKVKGVDGLTDADPAAVVEAGAEIPEGHPPEKRAPADGQPEPELLAEAQPKAQSAAEPEPEVDTEAEKNLAPEGTESFADKLPAGLKQQAAVLNEKYGVSTQLGVLGKVAEAKMGELEKKHNITAKLEELEKKHKITDQINAAKIKVETSAAELDKKHGISDMLEIAKTKAKEVSGYLEGKPDGEHLDSQSDSGSETSAWGGDDPLKHRWAFRIEIKSSNLPMVVGARASVFTLDPSTESGQTAWLDAILGTAEASVAGATADDASTKVDEGPAWLPANRQSRARADPEDKPLINLDLDLSREKIESYAAKKAAQSVAKRLSKTRTTALDEVVSAGKSGTKLSTGTNVEPGGVMSKLKGGAKDLKESAMSSTSSSSSTAAQGMDETAVASAKSSSKSGTSSSTADATSSTAEGASEAKGGGGVRDAALLGALVGSATSATSALHDSKTQAAELCRVADVVSSMSIGHLNRLVSDKTGRSVMQENHEAAVQAALSACEIDVESITATTRLAIGKAAVFGAASGGVPAAAAAAASKQAMMRGLGSKSAGVAGTIALAAFDIGKDATKVYGGEMDKEDFKKKAGGHVTTSAAGAAGAVQGASMGAIAGPAGSFVGAMLGGIGASIAAGKGYQAAVAEDPDAVLTQEDGERSPEEITAVKVAAREAKRSEIAAEFRDSEQVEMVETANGEPLKTLLRYMSTDELWRYLSDRSLFTRMGDAVLHADELRQAAMELLRPDGCLCLDEDEITAFPRAQLCRLLLDAGTCSREELGKLSDDELRIQVFDAYGSAPRYMDATGSNFAGKISPGGTAVAVHQVATAGPEMCEPMPADGISAPIRWLSQGEELQDCIAICPRTPALSFPQMLKNFSVHHPAAIVVVDSGRGSEGELTRMVQAPVPIPCVSISAETAVEIRSIIETSSAADVRTMVRGGPVLYISKTRVSSKPESAAGAKDAPSAEAQDEDAAPDPDVDAVPDPDAEPEPAPEAEQELPYEWVKFAQVASDKKLAFDAYSLQSPTSLQDEAGEMAGAAMVDVVQSTMLAKKSAERFLSKKFSKKGKEKEKEKETGSGGTENTNSVSAGSSAVEILHPPPRFDVSNSIVALPPTTKIGGAVPSQEDPAVAGCVVLIGPENIETDATPWHVLYCALKAGAIGVVWAAASDSLLERLCAPILDIPCVSISEETGKQLEQMVAKEAEADDMFAPIPTGGDGDAMTKPATLTAGLGLWINDSVRFESVAVGQDHCLALTNLGSVFSWGMASKGRLGLGQDVVEPQAHPTLVLGALAGQAATSVAAGHNFSYAISKPGTLYCWGCNDSPGFLGVGDTIDRWEPCEVTALRDHPVSQLAVQHTTTVCVTNEGTKVFCWGTLEVCGKGVIRMAERTNPVEVEIPDGLVPGEQICSVAAGRFHAAMASDTGRVWSWGRGRAGRLGLGKDKEQTKLKAHPTPIPAEHWNADPTSSGEDEKVGGASLVAAGAPVVTQVYAQDDFTFATTAGGDTVWAWGCNDFPGKLGLGDTKDRFVPTRVPLQTAASEDGDAPPLPPLMYFSGKLAVAVDGSVYHFSKDINPVAVVPPGMTAAQVSAAIGRGMAVSDTGRLFSFVMPKATGAASKKPKDGESGSDPFSPDLTEIHWQSLRATATVPLDK